MSSIDFNALSPAEQQALLDGPALAPPAGEVSVFDNPPNRNDMAHAIYGVCIAIGSLFVFMRIYGTWFCLKKAHISDYLMLVAYCLYLAFVSVILRQVYVGYFVHQWNFRLRDVPYLFWLFNVATNLFAATIMVIKLAILLEWLRIFVPRGIRNYFYWISISLICLDVLFYSAAIIAVNLTCIPHAKIWNRLLPGHCIESRSVDITSAVINFFIDVVILVLPQRIIWGLKLSFEKRIGVSAVFLVGFIACFAAGFRLAVTISYSHTQDVTYNFCTVGIWVVIECTCGLIVLCTPAIPKALSNMGAVNLYSIIKSWTARQTTSKRSDIKLSYQSRQPNSYDRITGPDRFEDPGIERKQSGPLGSDTHIEISNGGKFASDRRDVLTDTSILRTTHVGIATADVGREEPSNNLMQTHHPWNHDIVKHGNNHTGHV